MQLCDGVLAEQPTDEHLLNTLSIVYKHAGRRADVTAAYATAVARQPRSEALLEGLFACHVR